MLSDSEVDGGRLGGQEKPSDLQDGEPRGRDLSHVLHESLLVDHRKDLQTPATTKSQQQQKDTSSLKKTLVQKGTHQSQPLQQQKMIDNPIQNQHKGGMAKDVGCIPRTSNQVSNSKSKNKPSKKKKDVAKKRLSELRQIDQSPDRVDVSPEPIVDEYSGKNITPLQALQGQFVSPPPEKPPNIVAEGGTFNTDPVIPSSEIDEHAVINSEDDMEKDNLPTKDHDDDETCDHLIRVVSLSNDNELIEEFQQVTNNQGLSPRGINQPALKTRRSSKYIIATVDRPNTRLFTSRSSQ